MADIRQTFCSLCCVEMTGGRDTFGNIAKPLCLRCYLSVADEERRLRSQIQATENEVRFSREQLEQNRAELGALRQWQKGGER